jgi:hypothetical protein
MLTLSCHLIIIPEMFSPEVLFQCPGVEAGNYWVIWRLRKTLLVKMLGYRDAYMVAEDDLLHKQARMTCGFL